MNGRAACRTRAKPSRSAGGVGAQIADGHCHVRARYEVVRRGASHFPWPGDAASGAGVRENRGVTVRIHIQDGTPPYEQVRAQIAEQARSGELPVGYRLPTVRGLAETLGLAANTVAKAYRALEADGVIETRGRNGTVIAAAGSAAEREVAAAAQVFAERARRLGVGEEAAVAAVRDALRAAFQ